MKNLIIIGSILLSGLFLFSCKTENVDPLPDLTFQAQISGATSKTINFTLPMGTADTRAINGSYSSQLNLMIINALESQKWNMTFGVEAQGVQTGTYAFNQGQSDLMSFTDQETGKAYVSTSGSLTISKAELFQDVGSSVGAADDYFIDGTFNGTLVESGSNPPATITITGSFKGVNMKSN